ncbi:MAG: MoxR family ATPase [Candidatus Zixiibacteriota bacterium]
MLLDQLGIYGWKEADENLALASLLTGDPLLLIGSHGSAKTHLANKIAQALNRPFLAADSSKTVFEDLLGMPHLGKLRDGEIEFVRSAITVWDKEMLLVDEINRALPEMQSKWLEIIRSRKIMGFPTSVKWVWAAMNPISYSATNALDDALVGRFATFLYPPDVLQMNESDRIKVTTHINGEDAPSLSVWLEEGKPETVTKTDTAEVGEEMTAILKQAAVQFQHLKGQLGNLSEFLARFADLLMRETSGEITLDGRRLGFLYRNLLANRAVEIAKTKLYHIPLPDFLVSARYVVQSSIPVGLNEESIKREEPLHKMEICFDLLSSYFGQSSDMGRVNLIYELFTTNNLLRKAELLLSENLGDLVSCKAWNDLMNNNQDITLLAYTALQVEAHRPFTIPQELLEGLSKKISGDLLTSECIPSLAGLAIEHLDEVEELLDQDNDLGRLIAFYHVRDLVQEEHLTADKVDRTRTQIDADITTFHNLISNTTSIKKEVTNHANVQAVA